MFANSVEMFSKTFFNGHTTVVLCSLDYFCKTDTLLGCLIIDFPSTVQADLPFDTESQSQVCCTVAV